MLDENEAINLYYRLESERRLVESAHNLAVGGHEKTFVMDCLKDIIGMRAYGIPATYIFIDNENGARAVFLN